MEPIDRVEELFRHQRAVRAFTDQPVDDGTVRALIDAATRAPSSQNTQPWRFIVIRDADIRQQLSDVYEECAREIYGDRPPPRGANRTPWSDVPVLIAACVEAPSGGGLATGASIYPACQNLMLKARSLGLGTVLTTLFRRRIEQIREILGVPEGWEIAAILPVGWPAERLGANRRPPIETVILHDRWSEGA